MADEPDQERLRQLDQRIAKAKGAVAPKADRKKSGVSQSEMAWRMVIDLVAGLVIGMGIGFGLDALFDTRPLFLVLFVLLGFAAGVRVMLQTAAEMTKKTAERSASDEGE